MESSRSRGRDRQHARRVCSQNESDGQPVGYRSILLASGVPSRDEAVQLAQNLNGGSWTSQVLDSGKVDENRFLGVIGNFFHVPFVSIDPKTIDRQTLSILPSRFVFQHHILPIEIKEEFGCAATHYLSNLC